MQVSTILHPFPLLPLPSLLRIEADSCRSRGEIDRSACTGEFTSHPRGMFVLFDPDPTPVVVRRTARELLWVLCAGECPKHTFLAQLG